MSVRLRPDVLAHPSPSTARFLLLIGVLFSAGMVGADLLFLGLFPAVYRESLLDGGVAIAVVRVAGALGVAALSVLILLAVPTVLRERRKLREPGPALDPARARIAELAAQARVKPPRVLVGPAGQRDAYVFGLPGRYWLVMPTALLVRWRNQALFDPVVRHELAHVRRHDVVLAWLASTAWVAAIPALVLPFLSALVRFELGVAWSVLWQSALVLGVVWLLRREALRAREHDADLVTAKQMGDFRPLWTTLRIATGKPLGPWRSLVANHPTAAHRMEVLAEPERAGSISFVDGLAAAFLSMLIFTPLADLAGAFAAGVMVGPVLGLAVGAGLWRQALIDHVAGRARWPGGVAAGVVLGFLLGYLVYFGGLGVRSAWNEGLVVLTMVVLGAGTVALSAGIGRLWADAAAGLPGRAVSWAVGVLANSLFFGLALWAIAYFPALLGTSTENEVPLEVVLIGGGALIGPVGLLGLVPAAVAVLCLVARRKVLPVPGWLVEGQTGFVEVARRPGLGAVLLSGVIGGQVANLAVLAHRLTVGSPVDDDDRIGRYLFWVTAVVLVSLAVSLVTLAAVPRGGAPVALLNGLVAAVGGALGVLVVNTFAFGNPLIPSFWWTAVTTMTAVWFAGYLMMLPISLVSWPASWRDVPGPILLVATTVGALVTSLIVVSAAVALRQV